MQALGDVKNEATAAIASAVDVAALEKLRVELLGKKGRVTDLLKSLGQLDAAERPKAGAEINALKQLLNNAISERKQVLQSAAIREELERERVDVTLPGRVELMGSLHPITRTIERMTDFFARLGFQVVEGPRLSMSRRLLLRVNLLADTVFPIRPQTLTRPTHPMPSLLMNRRCPAGVPSWADAIFSCTAPAGWKAA